MGRPAGLDVARHELAQRRHVGAHVAVRRRDHRGRPPHHVVAREQRPFLREQEAEVVGGVPRRVHGLQRPARAGDDRPVREAMIRREVPVRPLLGGGPAAAAVRAVAVGRRAGRGLQAAGRGRVVDMGVGDDEMGHGLSAHRVEHGIDVLGQVGAGVDDGDGAAPDDVGAGAVEGEDARIARDHPADRRRDLRRFAVGEVELPDEGEGATRAPPRRPFARRPGGVLGHARETPAPRRPVERRRSMGIIAPSAASMSGNRPCPSIRPKSSR